MRLGCEQEYARIFCRRFYRLGVVCLLILSLIAPAYVGAIPSTSHPRYKTLFALSLEELINVRVDGAAWNKVLDEGTYVVRGATHHEKARPDLTFTQEQVADAFVSELMPLRTLDAGYYGGLAGAELAIDGYQSGRVGSFTDLVRYVQFFSVRLTRIEIYFGESAFLVSDGRAGIVVNLRTKPRMQGVSEVKRVEAGVL